jgi:dolichol-phosphate mannosyltransferase
MAQRPWLRVVAMTNTPPGKGNGQSAAFHAGFRAARGGLIAVLDADLQNDPADLVAMARLLRERSADMVQGDRSANRRDNAVRRWGSVVGRSFRRMILADTIRDTGCSLRLMKREIALRLPLEFRGVHRFIPASARHMGYTVVEMPVTHRPRIAGETKYGMGIVQRALPGLIDCFAVRWMRQRRRPVTSVEVCPAPRAESRPARAAPPDQVGGPR